MLRGVFALLVFAICTPPCAIAAVTLALLRRSEADLTVARFWGRLMLGALGARLRIVGSENIPDGPCIFASNHASNVDIWALLLALPLNTKFVAKAELFRVPFLSWFMRRAGFISIDRKDRTAAIQSLRVAAERIRAGRPVIVFPEGTRSVDGRLQPFKKGSFHLATRAEVPIVPIALRGTWAVLPPGRWYGVPGEVEVRFLPSVDVKPFRSEPLSALMDAVHERIEAGLTAVGDAGGGPHPESEIDSSRADSQAST